MAIPFPIGLLASKVEPALTSVVFTADISQFPNNGGFEDETDADGGTNLKDMSFSTTNPGFGRTVTIDLSANNILWNDRYNYRLGFGSIYAVKDIKLYKDGVLTETQAGTIVSLGADSRHMGVNIDPGSRNQTTILTGTPIAYPK